jgi:diguanylate cyclase (GGDEF)-like protein
VKTIDGPRPDGRRSREDGDSRDVALLAEIFDGAPVGVTLTRAGATLVKRAGATLVERAGATLVKRAGATLLERADATALERAGATALERAGATLIFANAAARACGLETGLAEAAAPADAGEAAFEVETGGRTFLAARHCFARGEDSLSLSVFVDITDRKRIESELVRRAHYDELTGLPNETLFQERVERAAAHAQAHFALVVIDIDSFKQINDHYGHAVGDAFLVKAGERIRRLIRESDALARIGGDEFLLMLHPLGYDDELAGIVEALVAALKEPFIVDGLEIFASASIGVASFPENGRDYETLRRNADRAVEQVRRDAPGGAALFQQELHDTETERVLAEQRLRLAIKDRCFRCAFQPKVDINTEEVYGVEALVRLIGEDGEVHGPGSFIPLATELRLMDDVTYLIVREAIDSLDAVTEAFGPQTTISVNVPARQASDVDFMRSLADMIAQSGCPQRFVVEVTEDAFVAKNRFQSQIVPMLRQIGVGVSIDDFGTGYSSLSALADITADELKVDRSFITRIHERPRSQIVLRAIESLGAALGMTVIAEGVETYEELLYLKSATRIRYVQGYYFARPVLFDAPSPGRRQSGEGRFAAAGRGSPHRRVPGRRGR